jgi:hypothetical protein
VPCPKGYYCPAWAPGENAKFLCPEFTYSEEGKSSEEECKSYGEILSAQLDSIYAAAKRDVPNYSGLACVDANKYEEIMSDKIVDKTILTTPWGKTIKVRSGSGCGCVDIYILDLDKKNCEHLLSLNDAFKAKDIWCSGYSIKANHGDRACSEDVANEVRFYYKKW